MPVTFSADSWLKSSYVRPPLEASCLQQKAKKERCFTFTVYFYTRRKNDKNAHMFAGDSKRGLIASDQLKTYDKKFCKVAAKSETQLLLDFFRHNMFRLFRVRSNFFSKFYQLYFSKSWIKGAGPGSNPDTA